MADWLNRSGSVCLDVINQTWSPMFDMINIFEVFLPQLLRYPNPTDPLNGEAAALLIREPKNYEAKVRGKLPHGRTSVVSLRSPASCPLFLKLSTSCLVITPQFLDGGFPQSYKSLRSAC